MGRRRSDSGNVMDCLLPADFRLSKQDISDQNSAVYGVEKQPGVWGAPMRSLTKGVNSNGSSRWRRGPYERLGPRRSVSRMCAVTGKWTVWHGIIRMKYLVCSLAVGGRPSARRLRMGGAPYLKQILHL